MKKGFTLVELLVVFSLIGIFFSVGIVYYQRYNRKQALFQAARTLKNDLRLVQSKALAGEKDCSSSKCGGLNGVCDNNLDDKSLSGWVFQFQGTGYEYHGVCGVTSFNSTPKILPTRITFTQTGSYTFSSLGRSYADYKICLKDSESTPNYYNLAITRGGEIIDENKISAVCN